MENGRYWLFDNYIFVLESFDGLTPPKDMRFDRTSLWLYLYQLPILGMHKIVGEKVRKSMGTIEEVEVDEHHVGWGKKLRV